MSVAICFLALMARATLRLANINDEKWFGEGTGCTGGAFSYTRCGHVGRELVDFQTVMDELMHIHVPV